MATLGLFYQTKGGARLPPYELPGEQQWRTDFLRWHVLKVMGNAALLPGHMRDGYLARAEAAWLEDGALTELEVSGVFECARRGLAPFPSEPATREEWDEFTRRHGDQRAELDARRKAIFGANDAGGAAQ